MIKAITLDFDMTLLDFMGMKRLASNAAAKAMVKAGLKIPLKKAQKELFDTYSRDIEGNTAFQTFLKKHKAYSERLHAAANNAHMKTKYTHLKPYPGVKETLRKLKKNGIKLAIVSDAPKLKAYMRLDALGIVNYFDHIIALEDTGRRKPSVLPFKKALKALKVKPSEAMHVGDWPDKDILGAKRIGMKTCFARYGYLGHGKIVYADYKIKKFEDLLKLVL